MITSPTRRQVLQAMAAAPLALSPLAVLAKPSDLLAITRLHPVRFVGGLVFDVARAVAVNLVADAATDWIRDNINGRRSYTPTASYSPSSSEPEFSHPVYKVSVVRLGVADFEAHERRILALKLKDEAQRQRFAALRDYLVQEKIEVKLADGSRSALLKADTPVDDLFTLDFFDWNNPAHQQQHYRQMIEQTGAKVFETWYA